MSPAQRRPGMDHDHYEWSPLPGRAPLAWPNGGKLALGVLLLLDHHEWQPPAGSQRAATMNLPDLSIAQHSLREYGHRVGFFRLTRMLEKYGLKPTVAMDAITAENYPFLARYVSEKGFEVAGHGKARTQMISSLMPAAEQAAYIDSSLLAVEKATGRRPLGWFGPDYGESEETPQLLAAAGLRYVCDWPNDDSPTA